jgi:hypothetical protein
VGTTVSQFVFEVLSIFEFVNALWKTIFLTVGFPSSSSKHRNSVTHILFTRLYFRWNFWDIRRLYFLTLAVRDQQEFVGNRRFDKEAVFFSAAILAQVVWFAYVSLTCLSGCTCGFRLHAMVLTSLGVELLFG